MPPTAGAPLRTPIKTWSRRVTVQVWQLRWLSGLCDLHSTLHSHSSDGLGLAGTQQPLAMPCLHLGQAEWQAAPLTDAVNMSMAVPSCADGLDSGATGGQSGLQLQLSPAAVDTSQQAAQVPAAQAPALQAADALQQQVSTSRLQTQVPLLQACPCLCSGDSRAEGGC